MGEFEGDATRRMYVLDAIQRHIQGDWGEMCPEDKRENERALKNGTRLMSAYEIDGVKVWVITEADRSVTTVLFPEDY
jgi:hypothetical protein